MRLMSLLCAGAFNTVILWVREQRCGISVGGGWALALRLVHGVAVLALYGRPACII